METILLTGASGFLGSALTRHFAGLGHKVIALTRPNSSRVRLMNLPAHALVTPCATTDDIAAAVYEYAPSIIIHTACSYGRKGEGPAQMLEANVGMGVALLTIVGALSEPCTFINTGTVLAPYVSLYALTKNQFSDWGRFIARSAAGQLQFIDVGLQHMYGPGDDTSKFTTHVIRSCMRNSERLPLTAGIQERDFIYIDDVVNAYGTLLQQRAKLSAHERIEVGSGVAPAVRDFVTLVKTLSGASTQLDFGAIPFRVTEEMRCVADTSRMLELGWKPIYTLEEGIRLTLSKETLI